MVDCDSKKYTRILQNLLWRNMSRGERQFIFVMNLFAAFPGFLYYISSVYDDKREGRESRQKPPLSVFGNSTKLSVIILLLTVVIIPILNYTYQSRFQKFRFAHRLSQSALFCTWVNSIFYIFSLNNYMKEKTRKVFKTRNEAIIYIGMILITIMSVYTFINPEYDDIRDLSKEVYSCKNTHRDIRALSLSNKSDNILVDSTESPV